MRRACLLSVVVLTLVPAGCGQEDERSAPIDTAGLAGIHHLSAAQYAAIEKAATADARFNELLRNGRLDTRSRYDAAITRALRTCGRLDGTDPLLSELFRSCAAAARVSVSLLKARDCGPDTCADVIHSARYRLGGLAPAYRRANRAIRATALPRACKRALVSTRADYARIRSQRRIFLRIERAIGARSRTLLDRAAAARARLDRRSQAAGARALRRFRSACR